MRLDQSSTSFPDAITPGILCEPGCDGTLDFRSRPFAKERRLFAARLRLGSLWLSQSGRSLADYCLRSFVVLEIARAGSRAATASWHQVAPFAVLPFVFCAPFHGPLCTNWPPRRVMLIASMACLIIALLSLSLLGPETDPWLWCGVIALTAAGHALYSPARYAALPPAAQATGWPLARLMSWMEGGSALAIVGGLLLGWRLHQAGAADSPWLALAGVQIAPALLAVVLINLLSWCLTWPATFAEPEPQRHSWQSAFTDFLHDSRRVLVDRGTRRVLLGLAYLLALVAVTAGALVAYSLQDNSPVDATTLPWIFVATSLGAALGSAVVSLQAHPRRGLGIAGPACCLLAVTLGLVLLGGLSLNLAAFVMGFLAGLANPPFRTAYLAAAPPNVRGNALAVLNAGIYAGMALASAGFFVLSRSGIIGAQGQIALVLVLAAVGCVGFLLAFKRETVEQFVEVVLWPIYRIQAKGPGLDVLPFRGPAIIIANHAAWFDPLWLGKVMPPALTPLMTSQFFDKPVLRWIMTSLNAAIRVEDTGKLRRDLPELDAAIELLDQGGTVLIFPEGAMRRKEQVIMRRFGQGIWRILCKRPDIPVFACWIDGGWGSYFSYWRGLPTKNKRMDFWRSVDIGVSHPIILDPEVLADAMRTRQFLMQACLDARRWLGREPYSLASAESSDAAAPEE
jgi:1-acyl-sn-glycerol-3-phosphate acyltransferase